MKRTRRSTYRAVSRRPKTARRQFFDTKKNLKDPLLRARWNNKLSPQANLSNLQIGDFVQQLADDELLKVKTPEKTYGLGFRI